MTFNPFDFTTYSFSDLSGSLTHPLVGAYLFTGQGVGQLQFQPNVDMTIHEYGIGGIVLLTKVPATGGKLIISCQQSSMVNKWLLYTLGQISGADNAMQEWGRMTGLIRNIQDGSHFTLRGISFTGIPPHTWAATGGQIVWELMYASLDFLPPNPSGAGQLSALAKKIKGLVT